jgi:septum formation protein
MVQKNKSGIILASASPRRKQLLAEAGYRFEVVPSDIDESNVLLDGYDACRYAKTLALAKAEKVSEKFPDYIVIGADTVVDFAGQIIGKATDSHHAEMITRKLFSAPHKVITGLAIIRLSDNINLVDCDVTVVYPKKLTDEQITEHIRAGSWRDKAGAYAIKETGDEFVERIDGSLTNVMGLPMELLQRMLEPLVN